MLCLLKSVCEFVCSTAACEQRQKWNDQAKPSFNPSAFRLEWGDATMASRLRQLDLEETASCLQGTLLNSIWLADMFRLQLIRLHFTIELVT